MVRDRDSPRSGERLQAGDRPLRTAADGISLNEMHAALEGAAVGWLAGRSGREAVAIATAVLALGWPARGPIGLRALAREPWWALAGLVVGVAVGKRAAFFRCRSRRSGGSGAWASHTASEARSDSDRRSERRRSRPQDHLKNCPILLTIWSKILVRGVPLQRFVKLRTTITTAILWRFGFALHDDGRITIWACRNRTLAAAGYPLWIKIGRMFSSSHDNGIPTVK